MASPSQNRQNVALLVDDETSVREFAATVMQQAGFLTLSACSATEALTLSRTLPERIDVLVTDFQLGDSDGVELAAQIRQDRRDVAVIVMSGTPDSAERANAAGYPFLAKPFRPVQLVDAIRRLLPAALPAAAVATSQNPKR